MMQCVCHENVNGRSFALSGDGFERVPELGYNRHRNVSVYETYHRHADCAEFVFCLKGSSAYSTPGGKFEFRSGSVFFSAPGQLHRLHMYHKNLNIYWVRFRVRGQNGSFLGLPPPESSLIVRRLLRMPLRVFKGDDVLKAAFRRVFSICSEASPRSTEWRMRLRAALLSLTLAVMDAGTVRPSAPLSKAVESMSERMRGEPERSYPVECLAEELHVSVSGLIAAFKRQTGYSPHAFLLSCRIERAKALLLSGVRVSAVADQLGFSNQKRFSTYFRQTVGVSPRQWAGTGKGP